VHEVSFACLLTALQLQVVCVADVLLTSLAIAGGAKHLALVAPVCFQCAVGARPHGPEGPGLAPAAPVPIRCPSAPVYAPLSATGRGQHHLGLGTFVPRPPPRTPFGDAGAHC